MIQDYTIRIVYERLPSGQRGATDESKSALQTFPSSIQAQCLEAIFHALHSEIVPSETKIKNTSITLKYVERGDNSTSPTDRVLFALNLPADCFSL